MCITPYKELEARPELRVCAWDIQCVKMPLKFSNAQHDPVMTISYMMDQRGYLIVNREEVSADIEDFKYTPLPQVEHAASNPLSYGVTVSRRIPRV
jgi:DNA polymerase epsilon subunit 1